MPLFFLCSKLLKQTGIKGVYAFLIENQFWLLKKDCMKSIYACLELV